MKGKDNILMNLMYDKKISIELCDNNSGNSSARCNNSSRCPGSNNGNCNPNNVWSGNVNGSSNAYNYYLNRGSWNQNSNSRTNAFSVRCVTDFLEKFLFLVFAKPSLARLKLRQDLLFFVF